MSMAAHDALAAGRHVVVFAGAVVVHGAVLLDASVPVDGVLVTCW